MSNEKRKKRRVVQVPDICVSWSAVNCTTYRPLCWFWLCFLLRSDTLLNHTSGQRLSSSHTHHRVVQSVHFQSLCFTLLKLASKTGLMALLTFRMTQTPQNRFNFTFLSLQHQSHCCTSSVVNWAVICPSFHQMVGQSCLWHLKQKRTYYMIHTKDEPFHQVCAVTLPLLSLSRWYCVYEDIPLMCNPASQ